MTARLAALTQDIDAVAAVLRVMSNPDRLAILCYLAGQEQPVAAIGAALHLRQPALSQHLGELRNHSMVTARREKRQVYYALATPQVLAMLEALNAGLRAPVDPPAPPLRKTENGEAAVFVRIGPRTVA